jgi:predicted nucleic acid-binding protein
VILYLGTSSLVKLYLAEEHSNLVREWVEQAEIVATCRVAYAELISAIDKRFRKGDISAGDYELVTTGLSEDWANLAAIDFDEFETGHLIRRYGLHRVDAIHLSAAKLLKKERKDILLSFSSTDARLCRAAAFEGLRILTFSPLDLSDRDYLGAD